jgi:hypothetical protein
MNAVMDEHRGHDTRFELNHELTQKAQKDLVARFRPGGRLRIPDLLESAGGLLLYRHLTSDVSWNTFLVADNTMYSAAPGPSGAHAPDVENEMRARAYTGARKGFACWYDADRLFPEDAPEGLQIEGAADTPVLAGFKQFLNSPPFLDLCRTVTGLAQIERADIRAMRLRPGQFVAFHSTLPYSTRWGRRLLAFEMNLTIEWKPEWGGLYEFKGSDNYVAEACIPSFNLLDIFSTHKGRWISPVAPFADGERLSISGWLYAQ